MKGSRHVAVVLAQIHFTTQPFVRVANSAVSSQFFELFFSVLPEWQNYITDTNVRHKDLGER